MAQVDFSNAVFEPLISSQNINPMGFNYGRLGLRSGNVFTDSSDNSITSSLTVNVVKKTTKEYVLSYIGTFSASGTEFYIKDSTVTKIWRVSNISFASGDTFTLQINCRINA